MPPPCKGGKTGSGRLSGNSPIIGYRSPCQRRQVGECTKNVNNPPSFASKNGRDDSASTISSPHYDQAYEAATERQTNRPCTAIRVFRQNTQCRGANGWSGEDSSANSRLVHA